MKFPSLSMSLLRLSCVGCCSVALAARACGPDFPNSYLNAPASVLLAAPPASFADEIARLAPLATPNLPWKVVQAKRGADWNADQIFAQDTRKSVLQAETEDLRAALAARGDSTVESSRIVEAYADCRQQLEAGQLRADTQLPAGLPVEFALYFRGAQARAAHENEMARQTWTILLALPSGERRYRSTWAAFMLAREWAVEAERLEQISAKESENAAHLAVDYARLTRTLAGAGLVDSQGLAAASLGWEAKAELLRNNYDLAINLYLNQYVLGDASALASLRVAASAASKNPSPDKIAALAQNPVARGVITAYLVARGGSGFDDNLPDGEVSSLTVRWAAALEKAGIRDEPQADRLAWVSYEAGQFGLAQTYATVAPEKSPMAEWIRAQLALRAGNLSDGEAHLRGALAANGLDPDQRGLIYAELSRTDLALNKTADALLASMDGGHAEDASYLGERILTLDELRAFVDTNCPEPNPGLTVPRAFGWSGTPEALRASMRALLARRLARADQAAAAESYFTADLRLKFHAYVQDVRTGFDVSRPTTERAASLWRAAQVARLDGIDLFGTALEPDWTIWGAAYAPLEDGLQRLAMSRTEAGGALAPTANELDRLAATPMPTQRFHYRYRAADLAWWAAALLPNDAEETAQILYEAGGWLKNRDPLAADKFYKALVIRCGNTPLGRAAALVHWFPQEKAKT